MKGLFPRIFSFVVLFAVCAGGFAAEKSGRYLADSPTELEEMLRYSDGEGEQFSDESLSPNATEGGKGGSAPTFWAAFDDLPSQAALGRRIQDALCARHERCAITAIEAQQNNLLNRPRPRLFILYHAFKTDLPAARA